MQTSLTVLALSLAGLCAASPFARAAGEPHQHGVARLDIAVDARRVTFALQSPLDNLLGFERAPRNDAERKQADAAVARLREAGKLFRIDPAAQCTVGEVELSSSALKLGNPDPQEAEEGHADIEGSFEFDCADATKATYVDVGLFDFARLRRLEVQVATPNGQFKRDLKRPATRVMLAK